MTDRDGLNYLTSTITADQVGHSEKTLALSLLGMDFATEDNVESADLPMTGGCPFLEDYEPAQDAEVIKRLRLPGT